MHASENRSEKGRYYNECVALTTKHGKQNALALPLRAGLGMLLQTVALDTDRLGTFTGEVERRGTPLETAVKKARLGMSKTGARFGLANEGSFGPHPLIPFIPGCQELIVFVDDELGIQVSESIISAETNYSHTEASSIEELNDFLARAKFPSHGLIVRANKRKASVLEKAAQILRATSIYEPIYKGVQDSSLLSAAIFACGKVSANGSAYIETDMRAHMNPTRMRVLRTLGIKLARRLQSLCPECRCPGFGITGSKDTLRCEECGSPSDVPALEVHSCVKCRCEREFPRQDGITCVEATYCGHCNP